MVWSYPNILGRSLISSGNAFQKPFFNVPFLDLLKGCTLPLSPKWMGWEIHSTVTALATNFVFFSVMPSKILALGGESKSQGTFIIALANCSYSQYSARKSPLDPTTLYNLEERRERRREGGKRREHAMVKCSEVQNSAAAEAFDLTIAAATAATTIAVADIHLKNEYQTVGEINTLNILLKLFSEDVLFFFCCKQKPEMYP